MKLSKDQKKLINNIIKYDTSRKYFGEWTPNALYCCYSALYVKDSSNSIPFFTGTLSESVICDTLWNEMSYNPVRFGTKSPFEKNGKVSLYNFSTLDIDPYKQSTQILLTLQSYLAEFKRVANEYDPDFLTQKKFSHNTINISLQKNTPTGSTSPKKSIPNNGYRLLSILVRCIHEITKQNTEDFKYKMYFDSIVKVATSRHPNFFRGVYTQNFSAIQRQSNKSLESSESKTNQKPETIQRYLKDKSRLKFEIADMANEISLTESRIDELKAMEFPGDTSRENYRLKKQKEYLEKLEHDLEYTKQKIKKMSETTKRR